MFIRDLTLSFHSKRVIYHCQMEAMFRRETNYRLLEILNLRLEAWEWVVDNCQNLSKCNYVFGTMLNAGMSLRWDKDVVCVWCHDQNSARVAERLGLFTSKDSIQWNCSQEEYASYYVPYFILLNVHIRFTHLWVTWKICSRFKISLVLDDPQLHGKSKMPWIYVMFK